MPRIISGDVRKFHETVDADFIQLRIMAMLEEAETILSAVAESDCPYSCSA
jgi:hypothetical protein